MKAQAFLELVGRMMIAQQDYFAARRKGVIAVTTQDLLIKSKGLEKQVLAVVKEGKLEPDEITTLVYVDPADEEFRKNGIITKSDLFGDQGEQP